MTQEQQVSTETIQLSIGKILLQKRQQLKIAQTEIAAYLKIKTSDVEAVENDDLEAVTKHIYVLGLIRSYAKFLKIEPQTVEEKIKLLAIKSNTENKQHLLINIGEDLAVTPTKDNFFNFVLIAILLLLVLLSLYNSFEDKSDLITNKTLMRELENSGL